MLCYLRYSDYMCHRNCIGVRVGLGTVEEDRVRELGLPAFDDHVSLSVTPVEELKYAGAGPESANTKKGDTTVQKFQLGPMFRHALCDVC